jgi:hypothetical protein
MYAHLGKRNLPEDDSGDSSFAKAKQSAFILAVLVASLLKSRDRMLGSCRDEKATIAHVIPSALCLHSVVNEASRVGDRP